MAPESERAKSKFWPAVDEDRNCTRCGEYVPPITESVERHECPPGFWKETKQRMTNPNEPTLTCSEVVPRKKLLTFPEWFEDKEGDIQFEDICTFHTDYLKRWVADYARYVAAEVAGEEVEVGRGAQQTKSSTINESPATCSEVVERLAQIAEGGCKEHGVDDCWCYETAAKLRTQAEAILHSWRERRVQELLELLRGLAVVSEIVRADGGLDEQVWCKLCNVREQYIELADIIHKPDCVLANSEWREQIRKGAKHE